MYSLLVALVMRLGGACSVLPMMSLSWGMDISLGKNDWIFALVPLQNDGWCRNKMYFKSARVRMTCRVFSPAVEPTLRTM